MTERERWIVYPLLFLALGASLRDKLVDRTVTKRIVCQELSIEDDDSDGRYSPRVYARLGHTEATAGTPSIGYLYVNGLVDAHGAVNVDGVLNARQFLPIAPKTQWSPLVPLQSMPAAPNQTKQMPATKQPSEKATTPRSPKDSTDEAPNPQPSKSNSEDATPNN